MDDTFAFVAPVMPRRRVNPLALKAGAASAAFVALVGAFGAFVVSHERAADMRIESAAPQEADLIAVPEVTGDGEALASLQRVSSLATDAFARSSSFAGAGIPELSFAEPGLVFVDGPSLSPTVISVAAGDSVWAAAVMGDSGCRWIVLASTGPARQGIGTACTGRDAMAALLA